MSAPILAGVELGGTKVCLVIGRAGRILERAHIATGSPGETLDAVAAQLARWRTQWAPIALGVGSFGPISIDRAAADFGRMLDTPKPGWAGIDVLGALRDGFGDRVGVHTDVTAAALAEGAAGAARGLRDHVYVTIGTGIGMGVIANGLPVIGLMHPEAGHMRVRRVLGDTFAGSCSFHGDCLEGLASGPAIAKRTGCSAQEIAADDPVWDLVADALAEACATLFLTLATARIVIGGGVGTGQAHLIPMIRRRSADKLAGYLPRVDRDRMADRVVPAALGEDAGPLGTLALAGMAAQSGWAGAPSAGRAPKSAWQIEGCR